MALGSVNPERVESTFQRFGRGRPGKIHGSPTDKAQEATDAGTKLNCTSFDWFKTWATSGDSLFGGRASLAYLKEHPEADESTHVVM